MTNVNVMNNQIVDSILYGDGKKDHYRGLNDKKSYNADYVPNPGNDFNHNTHHDKNHADKCHSDASEIFEMTENNLTDFFL